MPEKKVTRALIHSRVVQIASDDYSLTNILKDEAVNDTDEMACLANEQVGLIEIISSEIESKRLKPN